MVAVQSSSLVPLRRLGMNDLLRRCTSACTTGAQFEIWGRPQVPGREPKSEPMDPSSSRQAYRGAVRAGRFDAGDGQACRV